MPLRPIMGHGVKFCIGEKDQGVESYFFWEFFVYMVKVSLTLVTVRFSQRISPFLQVVLALGIVLIYAYATLVS